MIDEHGRYIAIKVDFVGLYVLYEEKTKLLNIWTN